MAPLLSRLPSGRFAARSFIVPRLRISIGRFDTVSDAIAADKRFHETGELPAGVEPKFKFVSPRNDGTWCYELQGKTYGTYDNIIEAAKARRQEVDNIRQRERRGGAPKKKQNCAKRAVPKTRSNDVRASEDDVLLIDYSANPAAAALVGIFLN